MSKKNWYNWHLYLGLVTGLIVFIVAVTGCCWAFKEEIESFDAWHKTVKPENKPFIPATQAKELALKSLPGHHIHGIIFGKKDESLEVVFYEDNPEFYQSVFLNPYSGATLRVVDHKSGFFAVVLAGHTRLWLPKAIGENVIALSTLIFLTMVISGIVLWWPKNKKARKQRLTFDWKATTRWKRKNFDLHAVVGFYASAFAFALAFTGCVMAYGWFYFIVFKATGGDKNPRFVYPENVSEANAPKAPIDALVPMLVEHYPNAKTYELHFPESDTTGILVEMANTEGLFYDMDYRFYDQSTLQELETNSIYGPYEKADFADHVIRLNYDIHIGAIGGLPGKILAFLASLLAASLPVTGLLMYLGRKNKSSKNRKKQAITQAV
ncbi:membrane protein (plasmid) [Fulvitalea axinellae]|uniref:Membrane protein n=1 Tax=Fulvitalea axinellae TaxID=1182444 RepID=A0AAU9CTI3_9BACT|nr:membrane protein [Fulvitalea axinellae]